jgi:protein arginine N-methyltransferase 1
MYSLRDYGNMISDAERFSAYSRAIAKIVRPGDTVAEIGSGPGVFALLACQAGAKKVYAIETGDIIEISKEIAKANGLTDRIEFIQADSRRIKLPERVHLIVSDIRGALPLFGQAIPAVEHARQHFLLPEGILVPQRDVLKAAVVQTEYYSRITSPWTNSVPSLNLSSVLPLLFNSEFYHRHFSLEQLLTAPRAWYVLDYTAGATT